MDIVSKTEFRLDSDIRASVATDGKSVTLTFENADQCVEVTGTLQALTTFLTALVTTVRTGPAKGDR